MIQTCTFLALHCLLVTGMVFESGLLGYGAPEPSYGAPEPAYEEPAVEYAAAAPSYEAAAAPDLTPIIIGILVLTGLSLLFPTYVSLTANAGRRKRSAEGQGTRGETVVTNLSSRFSDTPPASRPP